MAKIVFPVKIERDIRRKLKKKGKEMVKAKLVNSVNAMCENALIELANTPNGHKATK